MTVYKANSLKVEVYYSDFVGLGLGVIQRCFELDKFPS